jgi:hypothetical protein
MHTGFYTFPCPSKAEIMYKYKPENVNLNAIYRYALSNGALGFPLN